MFRDLVSKGKVWADRVANAVMNYSEVEAKVREATNDEPWGPTTQLMKQIADYTFSHGTCMEVMCTLWKRLHAENAYSWRRVYKSLILLDYLLKNGSEYVASGAREHIYDLRTLEGFQYFEDTGKDQGINVRIRVQDIINLLQDSGRLNEEREKAKANRKIFSEHVSSNGGFGSSYSSYGSSSYHEQRSDYNFSPDNSSRPKDTQQSKPQPELRLGSFEDWHVGRERGVVDDVVEQIKEAWDMTKMTAKDLFTRRDTSAPPHETNPRMVSEELYSFPPNAVDADATELPEATYSPVPPRQPSVEESPRRPVMNQPIKQEVKMAEHKPRPPSADLISGSWTDSKPTELVQFDRPSVDEILWPGEQSSHRKSETNSSNVPVNHVNLLDSDFGDFVSATQPASTNPLDVDLFDPIPAEHNGHAVPSLSSLLNTTPSGPQDSISTDLFAQPVLLPQPVTNSTVPKPTPNEPASPKSNQAPTNSSKQPTIPINDTWKELNTLRIDLDNIAMPDKFGAVQPAGPTLRHLQQQAQNGSVSGKV